MKQRLPAAVDESIQPFWERLPSFFLLPLSVDKLLYLLLLSAGSLVAFVLPVPSPLDVVIVEGVIWLTAWRHSFRTMELMAHGHVDAEAQADIILDDPERVNLPWKMAGLLICWGLIVGIVSALSAFLGLLASLFVSAALPAMAMQLCDSNSFSDSMSPARWWHFMRRIGAPYAALFAFLFLLSNGAPQALSLLMPWLGGMMTLPIVNFVMLYFNLVMFALMGYVMYQYHDALGLAVDVEPETAAATPPTIDARIAEHIATGQMAAAVELAAGIVRAEPENWEAYERLHKLLQAAGMAPELQRHNQRFFALAMRLGRMPRALALYRELAAAGDPVVLAGADVLPLAKAADKAHDTKLAIELVRAFDKRFPGHPDIPAVYFFSASVASERLRKDDLARGLLQEILRRYPGHAVADEAARYLEVIDRLAAPKPKGAA